MSNKLVSAILAASFVVGAVGTYGLTSDWEGLSAEQAECGNYAEMRKVWKESDGEYGWPAFDEAKENHCLDQ